MKIYTIHLDDFAKEIVLGALMEKAQGLKGQQKENILMLYGDIKEEIANQ